MEAVDVRRGAGAPLLSPWKGKKEAPPISRLETAYAPSLEAAQHEVVPPLARHLPYILTLRPQSA